MRQVLGRTPQPSVRVGEVGEEALGAALHDREQDSLLGAVVVVDGAQRDARLFDDARDGRRFEALLGHHTLGGIKHKLPRPHAAAVRGHLQGVQPQAQSYRRIGVDNPKLLL